MTPDGWKRIEAILEGALERSAAERSTYLEQACGGDQTLRREVESLLSFDGAAGQVVAGIVQGAAAEFQSDGMGLAEGERIGVYRVVREIGRGGMGTVYLAERDDEQFQKQVAIKLVTRGMDTADLLRRFRHERQILARLDHPYIARLLDGGSTGEGRPFLVMEYVEGAHITAWCSDRRLAARERIELFRKVCAAVQSAHQNLVVHRDLKPGNILVDREGSPKLLDFGIAKLLDPDDAPEFTLLAGGVQMLTPDYASPEQVRGGAITTATDVYSLGAILYELVAGVRPHRFQNYSAAEIERAICDEDPTKPSIAWKLAAARGENGKAPPLKAGDLDNIVLMAMQKEPARRYGSAAELSEDLRRYLEGLPVRARDDTIRYRARKFIRRHRASLAAAALLVATLAGGVTVSTFEARRAQRRFGEVRRIAHAVLYDIHDAIRDLPGSVKAREIVVQTALQYLDGLGRESAGDPGIQLELAEAYERVGDVQGHAIVRSLGKTQDALESYRKSMRIADALANSRSGSAKADVIRMRLRQRIAEITSNGGNIAGALELYRQGEEIGEASALRDSSSPENLSALSSLYLATAREDFDSGRSMTAARKGIALAERLAAAQPGNEEARFDLSDGHSMLGTMLLRGNQLTEALEELQKAVHLREALVAARPVNIRYKRNLMISYSKVGDVLGPVTPSLLDAPGAIENYRKALALAETLSSADPADKRAAFDHGMALLKTGNAMPSDRDHAQALALLRQALAIFESLSKADPASARFESSIAFVHLYEGRRLTSADDVPGALRSHREAIRIAETLIARDSRNLSVLRLLWSSGQEAAKILAARSQRSEALDCSRKAVAAALKARTIDGANAVTQAMLPQANATEGLVRATFAARAGAPAAECLEDWTQARASFEQSAAAWEPIQPQGGWPKDRDAQLVHARAEAARCAAALARLR